MGYTPMTPLTEEQQGNLKKVGIAVGVLVLVAVGSFSAGRFSAPLKTEVHEVEKVVEKIVFKDMTVEDITKNFTFAKTVEKTVYKNITTTIIAATPTTPATTVITDNSIEHEGAVEKTTKEEKDTKVQIVEHQTVVEKVVEKTVTVTLRPDWRVGLLVGASLREPLLPIAGPLVFGLSGERRIIGGLSVGAWGGTWGAFGGSASFEF